MNTKSKVWCINFRKHQQTYKILNVEIKEIASEQEFRLKRNDGLLYSNTISINEHCFDQITVYDSYRNAAKYCLNAINRFAVQESYSLELITEEGLVALLNIRDKLRLEFPEYSF